MNEMDSKANQKATTEVLARLIGYEDRQMDKKAIPAVQKPNKNNAAVSLVPRL